MNLFSKFFAKKSTFVGDFIETKDGLLDLVQSNKIVAAEFEQFQTKVKSIGGDEIMIEKEALRSAETLSGYGISVSAKAFLETL